MWRIVRTTIEMCVRLSKGTTSCEKENKVVDTITRIACGVVSLWSAERDKIMKGGLISPRKGTICSIDLETEVRRGGSPNSNRLQFGQSKILFQRSNVQTFKFKTDGTLGALVLP